MDVIHLQDRMNWGLNRAARILGHMTDAYRPQGVSDPLNKSNRYLRFHAAFSRPDGDFRQAVGQGTSAWRGYFDGAYTRVGDYLTQGHDIWFIMAQQSLLPISCVKINRVISITRSTTPTTGIAYGSSPSNAVDNVISGWPVSVMGISSGEKPAAGLPGDTTIPGWTVLLPAVHEQVIRLADTVTDEHGTVGVVIAAEQSDFGWRLSIRQATV